MKFFKLLFVLFFITNSIVHAQVVTDPWATIGNQARAIAVDTAGNVYTANGYNSTISKITPSGTLTLAWATLASGTGPGAIAADALGNVYTVNTNSTISKINATGTVIQSWSYSGNALGIVIDASNNIYCSNYTNSTIMKISAGGTLTNPWVSLASGSLPMSIAIDASGNLYTPNYNNANGTVSKITPSGSLTQTYASITSAPGGYPTFIRVDRFGNLYGSTASKVVFCTVSINTTLPIAFT